MEKNKQTKERPMTIGVGRDLCTRVRIYALATRQKVKDVVKEALEEYLERKTNE